VQVTRFVFGADQPQIGDFMSSVLALTSHLFGLGSHAMQPILMVRAAICLLVLGVLSLAACTSPDVIPPVTPTVINLPDLTPQPKPQPKPEPVPPVDGVLEIGTGDRPTLTVRVFYDANKDGKRGSKEIALERAGLRLTPVKDGPMGMEPTGPGQIARTSTEGVLVARIPPGLYSLEFVNIVSPGKDPNAALWAYSAAAERLEILGKEDKLVNLWAFCQVETKVQPSPVGVCAPQYDLRPGAFLNAEPLSIKLGGQSMLEFGTYDEATVTLEPFGAIAPFRAGEVFKRSVTPTVTTKYIMQAKNAYATREIPVTVEVTP
jgi:hypothetical protein